jgi:hypothetical protein
MTRVRIALLALMIVGVSCSRTSSGPQACLQFASDLMPDLAGGLIRKDFRIANAWAIKSDKMIDSSGVKFPAYFLSADIVAPNGEAVPGTWVTTQITKPGLIWSVSPQAQKYTTWAKAGDASTTGITMENAGAKESVAIAQRPPELLAAGREPTTPLGLVRLRLPPNGTRLPPDPISCFDNCQGNRGRRPAK